MDPASVPPEIAHTMAAAGVIAGVIRLWVGLMRSALLRQVWGKLPWWAKPTTLLVATAALGTLDAMVLGQVWYLAMGSALTGLGGAVVSHEWSDLFKEALSAKAKEEAHPTAAPTAAEALFPDHTPPSGVLTAPDTVPDAPPTESKPS